MKILFFDGPLSQCPEQTNTWGHFQINAAYGPTDNRKVLSWALSHIKDETILTNSLIALDHRYGWNKKEHHTDIYFYVESKRDFVRCDELAGRKIREGHNIMHMYLNGAFDLNKERDK